jgi:hypothetical protein
MLSIFAVGGGIAALPELLTSARERHREYLQTDAWRALRAAALECDGYRCKLCNGARSLQVHHRVYPRPWRPDRVEALTTLPPG